MILEYYTITYTTSYEVTNRGGGGWGEKKGEGLSFYGLDFEQILKVIKTKFVLWLLMHQCYMMQARSLALASLQSERIECAPD